tara:strand:- start:418 stop:1734 length:1317 start_codon:yes stop_codon:yes gene_type:complete
MALSKKAVTVGALGAVVLASGAYLGAKVVVAGETEEALKHSFARMDEHPLLYVENVEIERSFFETTATAKVGIEGGEQISQDATGDLAVLVKHGVLSQSIDGTFTPNQDFIEGVLTLDLAFSGGTLSGDITADQLVAVKTDAVLDQLVVDLEYEEEGDSEYKVDAGSFLMSEGRESVELVTPALEYFVAEDKFASMTWNVPAVKFTGSNGNMEVSELFAAAESDIDENGLASQTGQIGIGSVIVQGVSYGGGSLHLEGERWNVDALEALQKARQSYVLNDQPKEGMSAEEHADSQRDLMMTAMDNAHVILKSNPTLKVNPLEARITIPMLNIDAAQSLTADLMFDGNDLSKGVVYSAFWDMDYVPTDEVKALDGLRSPTEAQRALMERVQANVRVTTPPEEMLGMVPYQFRGLLDPAAEQQTLSWSDGELLINGQRIM